MANIGHALRRFLNVKYQQSCCCCCCCCWYRHGLLWPPLQLMPPLQLLPPLLLSLLLMVLLLMVLLLMVLLLSLLHVPLLQCLLLPHLNSSSGVHANRFCCNAAAASWANCRSCRSCSLARAYSSATRSLEMIDPSLSIASARTVSPYKQE